MTSFWHIAAMRKAMKKFGLPATQPAPQVKSSSHYVTFPPKGKTFWIRYDGRWIAYTRDPAKDK